MSNDWNEQDWDEPPPLELPGVLSLLPRLPRPIQGALLLAWWVLATLAYMSVGMSAFSAALLTLISLVALAGALLVTLWTRRKAWRDLEREELWRLAGWGAVGAAGLFGLPAVAFPFVVLAVLAIYAVIALPLQLMR